MRIVIDVGTGVLGVGKSSVQIVQFCLKAKNIQDVELAERPKHLGLGHFWT